jgi:hypothetical protein
MMCIFPDPSIGNVFFFGQKQTLNHEFFFSPRTATPGIPSAENPAFSIGLENVARNLLVDVCPLSHAIYKRH